MPQTELDKLPTIETHQHDPIEAAEKIIAGMPDRPAIRYEGSKATTTLPPIRSPTPHELFMSSREELIAEMGAAFLCATAGISPVVLDNQVAYVQGWLGTLGGDKRLVVIAAAQAQKAAEYILNAALERPEA